MIGCAGGSGQLFLLQEQQRPALAVESSNHGMSRNTTEHPENEFTALLPQWDRVSIKSGRRSSQDITR